MTQDFDVDAWLGEFADTTTDIQKDQLRALNEALHALYEEPFDAHEAFAEGSLYILDGQDAGEIVEQWKGAHALVEALNVRMRGALAAELLAGASETSLAEKYAINRGTVRKALGK